VENQLRNSECGVRNLESKEKAGEIRISGYQGNRGLEISWNVECEKIESYAEIMEKMWG
jgi:hypothetical protein